MKNLEIIQHHFKNDIQIVPLGDLHIGASQCMLKEIKNTIDYIVKNENVYCVLLGDIIDNGVITGKGLGVYDNNLTPMKQIELATELLKPLADNNKILCAVSGNHEMRSAKSVNMNPLYMICCELGIQKLYNDNLGILKITLGDDCRADRKGALQCYTLLIHHGKGTSESAIKKDHEFINNFEGVDCIVTGHTHNGRVAKFKKLVVNKYSNVVSEKDITIVVCNSFLKEADYGIQSMLVGASNDVLMFDLKCSKHKKIICHY